MTLAEQMQRPVYWMCHPLSGDVPGNLARAKRWYAHLLRHREALGFDVAADWILWCEVLDDADPACRADGISFDRGMVRRLDGVVLCGGRISTGMQEEREVAEAAGLPVLDWTPLGEEPGGGPPAK